METLLRAWGKVTPPEKITQEAWDRDAGHLRRLVRLRPGQRADGVDLWAYTQDLLFTEIQGPLLVYVLPFCMDAWREDLRGTNGSFGGFVEYFYQVLADRGIFEKILTPKQNAAISDFMRQTILEEIDDQRGLFYKGMGARPYRWFGALTTYGVLRPDIDHLFSAWWSLDTVGRAVAAVQYIACLMYPENENPVFAPWTREGGGGSKCLWGFVGHLYRHRWLQPNVDFLRGHLTVLSVSDLLGRAVDRLTDQNEHDAAAGIRDDLPLRVETLKSRCAELPRLLETVQTELFDWSR